MTSGNKLGGDLFQKCDAFVRLIHPVEGNLIDKTGDISLQLAVNKLRQHGQDEVKETLTRYRENFSLENLAALANAIGNNVLGLCRLAVATGIPLSRVLERMVDCAAENIQLSYEEGSSAIDIKQELWELLNQIRSEQEFEQKRVGGENWKANQVYKDFNKAGNGN